MFIIDNETSLKELNDMLRVGEAKILANNDGILDVLVGKERVKIELAPSFKKHFEKAEEPQDSLIYGKDKTKKIVNISIRDENIHIYRREGNAVVKEVRPFKRWVLAPNDYKGFTALKGNQHYRYIKLFSQDEFELVRKKIYQKDLFTIWDAAENHMVYSGMTYFKDMKLSDLSVLSFDIETTGLSKEADDAEVLIITNTFRDANGKSSKKLFVITDYEDQQDMIHDWSQWVQQVNPDILLGHNIVIYDLPYLDYQYRKKYGENLLLGRENAPLTFAERTSEFRKDGSQTYSYHKINCFGREVIDTFFLAVKFDIGRKYVSYGLKPIIKQEGLEKENRTFIDAGKIKKYYEERNSNPEMWQKTIDYAIDDSDDALKLFDLMVAAFFYLCPYIPKSFQAIIESATGSQINSFMVRSYLQGGYSVAKGSDRAPFEGAISFGNPGVYKNCEKFDVASLYPSIMRLYKISPKGKDFNGNFLRMLEYFTLERLNNKKKAKETGDRHYKDLEQAQKVVINSCYGFMGAAGLNYNYPDGAAEVTRKGREIITKSMSWATSRGFTIANGDTDSIMVTDGKKRTEAERLAVLADLNAQFDPMIKFEDDGSFEKVIILMAKNYVLYDGKKIKTKGSSLRDQKKEPALKRLLDEMIDALLFDKQDQLVPIYHRYVKGAHNPTEIKDWASKKTLTKAILECKDNPEARKNESNVWDAIKDKIMQEGDKFYVYPAILAMSVETTVLKNGKVKEKVIKSTGLKCVEDYSGDVDTEKLTERVYKTLEILENVIDMNQFVNYNLVKNQPLLKELLSA